MGTVRVRTVRVGTAGWTIGRDAAANFPGEGSHLERYARRLHCAEINSTFYRPPRAATWKRWAESVPVGFRFAVKAPRAITHDAGLACTRGELERFVEAASLLGERLGPLLFQLPPKLEFERGGAETFFALLREVYAGPVALEPRHASWFGEPRTGLGLGVQGLLERYSIARVAADPARAPAGAEPGGWGGLVYYRLHGSPRTYYSRYDERFIRQLADAAKVPAGSSEVWTIFDNTASGAAIHNALELVEAIGCTAGREGL